MPGLGNPLDIPAAELHEYEREIYERMDEAYQQALHASMR